MKRVEARSDVFPIALGRYLATVEVYADIAAETRSLLRDVIRPEASPRGASIVIRPDGHRHRITVDRAKWEPPPGQSTLDQLVYVLLRASLDAEPQCLHLHAGYVATQGRGVLLAGFPGSGKSTLVAQLVDAGFDYLTDERVGLDRARRLWPLPKPISLVPTSFPVLPHLDPAHTGAGSASGALWHVPASAIRANSVAHDATAAAIVFVQFQANAPLLRTDLHPVEAARLLLEDSPDARRFGAEGVHLAAGLCATHRCVRLVYGNAAHAIASLRQLALADPGAARRIVALPALPTPTARTSGSNAPDNLDERPLRRADGITGALVSGRCLLHAATTGHVIELDETASSWLQLLDGVTPLADIIAEVADANELSTADIAPIARGVVQQLIAQGVVR